MKDAYYFPHDCNARHDPKIVALCIKWHSLGYTAYFMTIEMLREQNDYKLQAKLKPCLQMAWSQFETVDYVHFQDLFNDMIKFGLLEQEGDFIYSPSLIKRMEVYDNRRLALREAGRKGGLSHAKAMLKPSSSKAQAVKESKVKESKVNNNTILPSGKSDDLLLKQQQSFDSTWALYPRKLGKPQAFSKYCKTVLTAEHSKQCKRAVENYVEEIEDKGTEEKFIKHGSTFFGMWQDYYHIKPFEADQEDLNPSIQEFK